MMDDLVFNKLVFTFRSVVELKKAWGTMWEAIVAIVRDREDGERLAKFVTHEGWPAHWDKRQIKIHLGDEYLPLRRVAVKAYRDAVSDLRAILKTGVIRGRGFQGAKTTPGRPITTDEWDERHIDLFGGVLSAPQGGNPQHYPMIYGVEVLLDDVLAATRKERSKALPKAPASMLTKKEVEDAYQAYVAEHENKPRSPSVAEDLTHMRSLFPSLSRKRVRELRQEFAPDGWGQPGTKAHLPH
jgi:hypothetical protein